MVTFAAKEPMTLNTWWMTVWRSVLNFLKGMAATFCRVSGNLSHTFKLSLSVRQPLKLFTPLLPRSCSDSFISFPKTCKEGT